MRAAGGKCRDVSQLQQDLRGGCTLGKLFSLSILNEDKLQRAWAKVQPANMVLAFRGTQLFKEGKSQCLIMDR